MVFINYILLLSSILFVSSCSSIDLSFFNGDTTPWDSPEGQSFKKTFIKNCNESLDRLKFCLKESNEKASYDTISYKLNLLKDSYCDCMFEKIILKYPTYGSIVPDLWKYRFKLSEAKRECGVCYQRPQ